MGMQKAPVPKTYKISIGSDSINVDFLGPNRQFDQIKYPQFLIKLTNTTIYDSYNVELAAQYIKSVKLSNLTEICSLTNEKYDTANLMQKHLLYKRFVTWRCNGCSTGPSSDYINNPVYQELIDKDTYDSVHSKRLYLDLRASAGCMT